MAQEVACFKCATVSHFEDKVPYRSECAKCLEDLHCCKNCQHFDPNASRQCREPSAEPPREKERSNFCDYFCAKNNASLGAGHKRDDLLSAAEALFKKKE